MDLPPPGSALVPFLLVLAAPTPGSCCSFGFNPVSSTFSAHLNKLTPWLLLDYPVAMPSNLEPDSACSDLWGLHFGALALRRMIGVAGKDLAPLLKTLLAQLQFVDECHIQDPQGCVRLETVNVSQLLETLAQHLRGLQGRPPHYPGCARLRCHPGWPEPLVRNGDPPVPCWKPLGVHQDLLEPRRDEGAQPGPLQIP
ncbi:hypothetical protein HGM15179_019111 [Zosterops borbonicus]|uniref:Fms-related tyrosine kinase 3 ligand n=1 Tax=Zosterops borbonicus TaxID=364589 RepID=A0A8K1DAI7_9PASS|nr:hypothetical protein HGM15179_019111 [Zosterops borbonicus]